MEKKYIKPKLKTEKFTMGAFASCTNQAWVGQGCNATTC